MPVRAVFPWPLLADVHVPVVVAELVAELDPFTRRAGNQLGTSGGGFRSAGQRDQCDGDSERHHAGRGHAYEGAGFAVPAGPRPRRLGGDARQLWHSRPGGLLLRFEHGFLPVRWTTADRRRSEGKGDDHRHIG